MDLNEKLAIEPEGGAKEFSQNITQIYKDLGKVYVVNVKWENVNILCNIFLR